MQENSPGHKAGLEAFFDFVVAIGNTRLVGITIGLVICNILVTMIMFSYLNIFRMLKCVYDHKYL